MNNNQIKYVVDLIIKLEKIENNRNKAIREIMYMIENCDISYYQGKKIENILMGDDE